VGHVHCVLLGIYEFLAIEPHSKAITTSRAPPQELSQAKISCAMKDLRLLTQTGQAIWAAGRG
jgi:hypothetical protein